MSSNMTSKMMKTGSQNRVSLFLPLLLVLFSFLTAIGPTTASAEAAKKVKKTSTTVTTVESEGEEETPAGGVTTETRETESSVTAKFGSKATSGTTGCKTEDLAKSVIKDLKADCNAWVKDQKAELKGRFLTSICEESCEDCGMSLKRCSVNGTVKYLLKK